MRCLQTTTSRQYEPKPVRESRSSEIDRNFLRNIGIVAHINAGKTTTTERILYHAGSTETVGDVDKGNTVTDYLVQERDRGITITSAAVSFDWKKHRINLIDTPGHVDFTIEVERSLSVLDGVVTILDASAGVEAQTVTVWNQANKYKLPNVIFLNKYDKTQADYKMCLKNIGSHLEMKACLTQLPIKQKSQEFSTIVDIIHKKSINWKDPQQDKGAAFTIGPLQDAALDKRYLHEAEQARELLINVLSDLDESFASHVIDCDKISDVSSELIVKALRRATLACKLCPVLVGSSFKFVGVQQLMNAVIDYLPSPIERENQIKECLAYKVQGKSRENCLFIFKILHNKRFGPLSYVRVCNGSVVRSQRLKNLETGKLEQVKKVYRAFADELREVERPISKDDIIVLTGLTESRTGDVLVDQSFSLNSSSKQENVVMLSEQSGNNDRVDEAMASTTNLPYQSLNKSIFVPRINQMDPVYFCSIEAPTASHQVRLEHALACMAREDPSFTFEIDSLGATTIRGMGKLHLEVARDRIHSEHGVNSVLGPMQISYRETIEGYATEELSLSKLINSVNNTVQIRLYVRAKEGSGSWSGKMLRLDTSGENSLSRLRQDHRKAIENGLMSALMHGPSMGYPMIDCDILLLDFKANHRCGLPVISSAASQCLANAISRCSPILLEPIMLLEVVTPAEFNSILLGDIATRRGLLLSTQSRANGSIVIRSKTPLATLADYSEFLRISTSGRGSFSMELNSYSAMSEAEKRSITRL